MNLDSPETYATLDPSGMAQRIAALPFQCRQASRDAQAFTLPKTYRSLDRIVVFGMGGSAIGADIVAGIQEFDSSAPVEVVRGYDAPATINSHTLAIASSFSGNTEETLSAFQQALGHGAQGLAITTGGALAALSRERGIPVLSFADPGPPRTALGYGIFPLVVLLQRLGLGPDRSVQASSAFLEMERVGKSLTPDVRLHANPAKDLARNIGDRAVVIYGAQFLGAIARRWRTQIAENAKSWAFFDLMPEMHHNAIEGMAFPQTVKDCLFGVVLHSPLSSPLIARRSDFTAQVLARASVEHQVVDAQGASPLAHALTTALFGDYLSYYLAIQRDTDPTPTPTLDWFKKQMATS